MVCGLAVVGMLWWGEGVVFHVWLCRCFGQGIDYLCWGGPPWVAGVVVVMGFMLCIVVGLVG